MESEWVDQVFFCGGCNLLTLVGIAGNIFSVATLYPSKYSRTKGLFYRYLYPTTTPHLHPTCCCRYLTALAVADLLFLAINLVYW